jgi:hypothetical protein
VTGKGDWNHDTGQVSRPVSLSRPGDDAPRVRLDGFTPPLVDIPIEDGTFDIDNAQMAAQLDRLIDWLAEAAVELDSDAIPPPSIALISSKSIVDSGQSSVELSRKHMLERLRGTLTGLESANRVGLIDTDSIVAVHNAAYAPSARHDTPGHITATARLALAGVDANGDTRYFTSDQVQAAALIGPDGKPVGVTFSTEGSDKHVGRTPGDPEHGDQPDAGPIRKRPC